MPRYGSRQVSDCICCRVVRRTIARRTAGRCTSCSSYSLWLGSGRRPRARQRTSARRNVAGMVAVRSSGLPGACLPCVGQLNVRRVGRDVPTLMGTLCRISGSGLARRPAVAVDWPRSPGGGAQFSWTGLDALRRLLGGMVWQPYPAYRSLSCNSVARRSPHSPGAIGSHWA